MDLGSPGPFGVVRSELARSVRLCESLPSFCRHNRLTQNCPICTREQNVAMRPVVSGGAASVAEPRERTAPTTRPVKRGKAPTDRAVRAKPNAVKVQRLTRGAEDGFSSSLLPGLKSSEDAGRLVEELAFAASRLTVMALEPPGVWAQIAGIEPSGDGTVPDLDARTTLAFETALHGERGVSDPDSAAAITDAYQAWVQRAGSQEAAFTGEPFWTPERRFERIFERLSFQGFPRDSRFELLVMLGRLNVYEMSAGNLELTGENEATWAAKRALGIAEPILLERRARDFAEACGAPLDALDLGFHNWGTGKRIGAGVDPATPGDEQVLDAGLRALAL